MKRIAVALACVGGLVGCEEISLVGTVCHPDSGCPDNLVCRQTGVAFLCQPDDGGSVGGGAGGGAAGGAGGGVAGGGAGDSGVADAGPVDAGPGDAGPRDGGSGDAGFDGGSGDAGTDGGQGCGACNGFCVQSACVSACSNHAPPCAILCSPVSGAGGQYLQCAIPGAADTLRFAAGHHLGPKNRADLAIMQPVIGGKLRGVYWLENNLPAGFVARLVSSVGDAGLPSGSGFPATVVTLAPAAGGPDTIAIKTGDSEVWAWNSDSLGVTSSVSTGSFAAADEIAAAKFSIFNGATGLLTVRNGSPSTVDLYGGVTASQTSFVEASSSALQWTVVAAWRDFIATAGADQHSNASVIASTSLTAVGPDLGGAPWFADFNYAHQVPRPDPATNELLLRTPAGAFAVLETPSGQTLPPNPAVPLLDSTTGTQLTTALIRTDDPIFVVGDFGSAGSPHLFVLDAPVRHFENFRKEVDGGPFLVDPVTDAGYGFNAPQTGLLADVDGDGKNDLLLIDSTGTLLIFSAP